MKFCQCYTDVTKVTVHSQHAKLKNQMLQCYGVTAHPWAKKQEKYVNYHKLLCCTLKVCCSLHRCYNSYSAFSICPLYESNVTVLQRYCS